MIIVIAMSVSFIVGFVAAYYKMPEFLDFMIEKSKSRGFFIGSWKTHLGAGKKETNFIEKAAIARIGLGANTADETVYWNAFCDSNGDELNTKNNYKIVIEKTLPIEYERNGFWSITAYGANQLLMENEAYKYLVRSEDFESSSLPKSIYLSVNQNKEEYHIPLSQKEQKFTLAMRCYRPMAHMKEYDSCINIELPKIIRL